MIWCTLLNPALDILYKMKNFKAGSTYTGISHIQYPAGKGLNVAQIIQELGEEVGILGLLPEFDKKRIQSFLKIKSIPNQFLTIPGALRINTTIIDSINDETTHLNSRSSSLPPRIQDEFFHMAQSVMNSGDYWVFSGSLPQGFSDDAYASLCNAGNTAGVLTLLDCSGSALQHGIRSRPMMVKPNLTELEEFYNEPVQGVHHIALKGKRLLDMGVAFVFISLGSDGMIALHENDCLLCCPPDVVVCDTVGCGDAMVAGVIVAHKRMFSFSETCRLAVACGSAKSMVFGPGNISRDIVWKLMEDVSITAI